jgi:hypothetical protein
LAQLHTNKPSFVIDIVLFVTNKGLFVTEITLLLANKPSFVTEIVLLITNKAFCIAEEGLSVTDKPSSITEIGLFVTKIGLFVVEIYLFVTDLVFFGLIPFIPRAPFQARGQRQPRIHWIKLGILVAGWMPWRNIKRHFKRPCCPRSSLGEICGDDVFGGTPETARETRALPRMEHGDKWF